VVPSAERGQRSRGKRRVADRRLVVLLEPAQQPARRDARVPVRILERDQGRELEQLAERRPAELAERRLGDEEVAALERPLEDRSRMALRGDPALRSGAGRRRQPIVARRFTRDGARPGPVAGSSPAWGPRVLGAVSR